MSRVDSKKNFTSLSGKLSKEFTSPIAKSTSSRLLNTTFYAHCTNLSEELNSVVMTFGSGTSADFSSSRI